jgi:hypothetical protein
MTKSDAFDIQGLALRRLYVAGAVAVVAFVVAWLAGTPWSAGVLIGWSAATLVFLTWVWLMIGQLDAKKTAQFAVSEDDSRAAADATLIGANVVAPLMTPIFGIALGLARADLGLLRTALIAELGGALVGIVLCFGLGLLPFAFEATPSLLAQTTVAELSARSNSLEEAFFALTEGSTDYSASNLAYQGNLS